MKSVVYNTDCLEAMRQMGDKAFDLAIVDPPYAHNSGNAFTSRLKRYGSLEFNDNRPSTEYFNELRRVSENQIIWGGNYFLSDLSDTKCLVVWYKHQPVVTYADAEIAWTSFQTKHTQVFDYPFFGATNRESHRSHPNQKPIALYRWLLQNYAKEGNTILDTHLGSGSSRIAAYDLGFDFTGYELDKDYFEAQEKRFAEHLAQPKLFVPETVVAAQEGLFTAQG